MTTALEFEQKLLTDAAGRTHDDPPRVARFASLESEYAALHQGAGLVHRADRALLEITGNDRLPWLHNLTTNHVRTLGNGDGNYAFCCDVKGRIQFDLNVIARAESLWIELDHTFLDTAKKHFEKYTIVEDVTVTDRSEAFVRLTVVGPQAAKQLAHYGAAQIGNLPILGQAAITIDDVRIDVVRTDFCGPFALDLFVPADKASDVWKRLVDGGATPVGADAVEVRRIEAGIPRPGREITDEYLPAETGQFDRAVSFNKGCYLGQEVVERMRSRGVVARKLVGLVIEGDELPPAWASIVKEDKPVGTVTSACQSPALKKGIALGYARTAAASPGTELRLTWDGGQTKLTIAALPFVGNKQH